MPTQTTRTVAFQDNTAADPQPSGSHVCADCTDGLGKPKPIEPGTFRARMHANKGIALAWRVGVFLAGLVCVAIGIALTVLPGPLTIPPIVLGLWIWSSEFAWARALFATARRKARDAWTHAKQHPASSIAVTVGGLAAAGAVVWAVGHFGLVDRATTALGL
jgi:hypothetical protein